jgi:hypothetical protein
MIEIGKTYRFIIKKDNETSFYTGKVINKDSNLISIIDKFGNEVGFNKDLIQQYKLIGDSDGHNRYEN